MNFDVAIIGSGLAGLSRRAAPGGHTARRDPRQAQRERRRQRLGAGRHRRRARFRRQHGQHVDDTLVAGAGLCDAAATRFIVEHRPRSDRLADRARRAVHRGCRPTWLSPDARRRPQPRAASSMPPTPPATPCQPTLIEHVRSHPNITLLEAPSRDRPDHVRASSGFPAPVAATACMRSTIATGRGRHHRARRIPSWPPAAPARSTSTPPTPTPRPATASRWPGAPAAAWRTWSSSSSIRPACTTRTPSRS